MQVQSLEEDGGAVPFCNANIGAEFPLCAHMGIDLGEIESRIKMIGLTPTDVKNLKDLGELFGTISEKLADRFYHRFFQYEELRPFVQEDAVLRRLKDSLIGYISTIGQNLCSMEYFESRLQIGTVHEKLGISPKWYMAGVAGLQTDIFQEVSDAKSGLPNGKISSLLQSLQKIFTLDTSLVLEIYHRFALGRAESLLFRLKEKQKNYQLLARTDSLTNLFNRRYFLERFQQEWDYSQRHHRPSCLIVLDIDDFKSINDQYGHLVGDNVLREVSQAIKGQVRETDLCGRMGGEEFSLLLVEADLPDAHSVAERIRRVIAELDFTVKGEPFSTSASFGVAQWSSDDTGITDLISRADAALYQAKTEGKNCIRLG
ncbi:MAG: hypothetical protein Tsb009_08420 [Planctomycetaceae bacterium]